MPRRKGGMSGVVGKRAHGVGRPGSERPRGHPRGMSVAGRTSKRDVRLPRHRPGNNIRRKGVSDMRKLTGVPPRQWRDAACGGHAIDPPAADPVATECGIDAAAMRVQA